MKKLFYLISILCFFSILLLKPVYSEPKINIYNTPKDFNKSYSDNEADNTDKQNNLVIILDCSYSMDDQIDGQRKIDIAKNVINKVLRELPGNTNVGLRVYGHKSGFLGFDGCTATELLVPIGRNNPDLISDCLKKLDAVGWTPICYSLEKCIENDFNSFSGNKRIILVSDGMETCGGSPCEFAVDLMKKRTDVSIDVIGFDIESEPAAISQLKCVAMATHGRFYRVNNADELFKSLKRTLNINKKVEGKIYSK